jgi:hypothetical protein
MNRRFAATAAMLAIALGVPAFAGSAQMQQQVAALQASIANNKASLATYTWQQLETVAVKGEVKKQLQYQVQIGPNGQPQKTPESVPAPTDQGRQHGIRHRVEENMAQDYEDYAKQIAALGQSYVQPQAGKIQQLYQQGQVTLGSGGAPGLFAVTIHNYVKPGDLVAIVFNKAQKAIVSANIASYLSSPSDAVTIKALYGQLGDGTNYVQNLTINGTSKQMVVTQANSDYQKR